MATKKLFEGGAMPHVGPVHISEIDPTLKKLEKVLGINLRDNTLGSVYKKEFSGDIDVALEIDTDDIPEFINRLKQSDVVMDVAKSSVIMTKVKIVDYDESKQTTKPRTGFVQVDFMPGDPAWMKTFYHAPNEKDSKYKGVFRNLLVADLAKNLDVVNSEDTTDDGRPLEQERWMWGSKDGLVRVIRKPVPRAAGPGYTKKNKNEIIAGPFKDPEEIAEKLGLDSADALYSYETLKKAIEKNYPKKLVDKVLDDFANSKIVKDVGVPDDIKKRVTTEGTQDWYRQIMDIVILD